MADWAVLDSVVRVTAQVEVLGALTGVLGAPGVGRPPTALLAVRGDRLERDGAPLDLPGPLLLQLLVAVNAVAVEQCASLCVHAGVLARDGRAVAFPAVSGAGKSTLVAAGVLRGLDYVSDEALVVQPDGGVRPYPRPIGLAPWSLARLGLPAAPPNWEERPVPAVRLGRVAQGPLRLAHLVVLERPGPLGLVPLPRAAAATALLRRSFNSWRDPGRAHVLTAMLARGAQCWTMTYNDPVTAAGLLADLLASA